MADRNEAAKKVSLASSVFTQNKRIVCFAAADDEPDIVIYRLIKAMLFTKANQTSWQAAASKKKK